MIKEINFISELLHEVYSTTTLGFDPLCACWIREFKWIKTTAFVSDDKLDLMLFFMTGYPDLFFFIQLIAMDDSVVDRFSQADENVWIQIFIYMQTLHQVPDKGFNFADATGMRGKFQYFCTYIDGRISLYFSTIDNTPQQETCSTVSGQEIRICIVRFLPRADVYIAQGPVA